MFVPDDMSAGMYSTAAQATAIGIDMTDSSYAVVSGLDGNVMGQPAADEVSLQQPSSRGVCLRVVTCLLLIVLPIFVASTFITYFLMRNTGLGSSNDHLHEYAIYAFIIFSVASVFPFGLFFVVVIIEKIHSKYKRSRERAEAIRIAEEESRSFSANIYEHVRPDLEVLTLSRDAAIVVDYSRPRGRRGTLIRQEAFEYDHPPDYNDLAVISPQSPQGRVRDEQPPSYEMAILCPMVVQGHCSFESDNSQASNSKPKQLSFDDKPPSYSCVTAFQEKKD